MTLSKLYKYMDSVKMSATRCAGVLTYCVKGTSRLPLGRETKLHCRIQLKEYTLIFYVFIYATGNSLGILRRFLPVVFWVIRITANPLKHNICLFYCHCLIPILPPVAIGDDMERSSISSTIAAVLVWQYLTLYVQFCAPDDRRRTRLKHVEQFIEINRSRKRCILQVVLQRYGHHHVRPVGPMLWCLDVL